MCEKVCNGSFSSIPKWSLLLYQPTKFNCVLCIYLIYEQKKKKKIGNEANMLRPMIDKNSLVFFIHFGWLRVFMFHDSLVCSACVHISNNRQLFRNSKYRKQYIYRSYMYICCHDNGKTRTTYNNQRYKPILLRSFMPDE